MNTVSMPDLKSCILLQINNGAEVATVDLTAAKEHLNILCHLAENVGYGELLYHIAYTENPGRQIVSTVTLGKQTELEEMTLVSLILHLDAVLQTLEMQFKDYRERMKSGVTFESGS